MKTVALVLKEKKHLGALVLWMIFMSLHLGCNRDEGASITRNQGIGGSETNNCNVQRDGDSNGGHCGQQNSNVTDEFQTIVEDLISASNLDHLEDNKPSVV